jgi:predicted Zn-dependent protease
MWKRLLLPALMSFLLLPAAAFAQSFIRDAEIEQTLRLYATPIFKTAGLTPENIHLFIINDPSINAFVAGGSNMFFHTGLLLATEEPGMLIGVIAHETGHIAGGHLALGTEELANAQIGTILSYVLGAAAGIAGGSSDVGAAVISAGQHVAQRNILSFTRMNEQAADQAALTYLGKNNISADGLLQLLERLRLKETAYRGKIDPYALTHPLSKERIGHIRGNLLNTSVPAGAVPAQYLPLHQRLHAKLLGFIQKPEITLRQYPADDVSVAARYARAVAYHRQQNLTMALKEIDSLLKDEPRDPFYLELKGQILAESGRYGQALPYYRDAATLLPDSALLQTEYGATLLAQSPPHTKTALGVLKKAASQDSSNPQNWHLLAECYADLGDKGQAELATAEEAFINGQAIETLRHISLALKDLPRHSPSRLRAEDLKTEATRLNKKQQEDGDFQ